MLYFALAVLIQIACAVHCVRGGRNSLWLMVIIFLSLPGCLAYFIFEILPELTGRREVKAVKQAAAKAIDPERDIRRARDALVAQGRSNEAIPHFEAVEAKAPAAVDRAIRLKLARACFETGRPARARALVESLPPGSQSENDRANLLLARLLEEDGEDERALALYAEVGERLPGAEAQCRQAALLMALGRRGEALTVLAEAEKRAKRIDRHQRGSESDMYDWAAENLAALRAEQGQAGG